MGGGILGSLFLLGLGAGILSGMLGVGGGTVLVPGMVLLLGFTQQMAQGVSLAVMIPTAALGAYGYYKKDKLDLKVGSYIMIGSVVGVVLGAYIAALLPADQLKKFFALFIIFVGTRMGLGK